MVNTLDAHEHEHKLSEKPSFLEGHRNEETIVLLVAFGTLLCAFLVQCLARLRLCNALKNDLRSRSSSFHVTDIWDFDDREKVATFGLLACLLTLGAVVTSCRTDSTMCLCNKPVVGFGLCAHAYFMVFCGFCSCARASQQAFQRAVVSGQQRFGTHSSYIVGGSVFLHFIGLESSLVLICLTGCWWPLGVFIATSNIAFAIVGVHLWQIFRRLEGLLGKIDETQTGDLRNWMRCRAQLKAWRRFLISSLVVILFVVVVSGMLFFCYTSWAHSSPQAHTSWTDLVTLSVFTTLFSLLTLKLRYAWVPVFSRPPVTDGGYYTDREGKLRFSLE